MTLLLTCEHATNRIPPEYARLFSGYDDALASHRGWDPGAFPLALALQEATRAPLGFTDVSRLLIEGNRTRSLWSERTRGLPDAEKERIRRAHHAPFYATLDRAVAHAIARGGATHVSVHTFTPVLDGVVRDVDIGVLYDPARDAAFADALHDALVARTGVRVGKNKPYDGRSESSMAYLRERYPRGYVGVAIEVNQGMLVNGRFPARITRGIVASLLSAASPS